MVDLAPVAHAAQPGLELAESHVECGVTVVGCGLGSDHGTTGDDGEFDAFTGVGLTRVVLLRNLHVDPDDLGIQLLDLGKLGVHMTTESIVDVRMAGLHDDIHGDPPPPGIQEHPTRGAGLDTPLFLIQLRSNGGDTRPADLVFVPTSAC